MDDELIRDNEEDLPDMEESERINFYENARN